MLASKPTSGLSLVAMIERDESLKNCVAGAALSCSPASGSGSYARRSNRLVGLSEAPRPCRGNKDPDMAFSPKQPRHVNKCQRHFEESEFVVNCQEGGWKT